jgi:hypothetical protein
MKGQGNGLLLVSNVFSIEDRKFLFFIFMPSLTPKLTLTNLQFILS